MKKVMICGGGHVCFYLAIQLHRWHAGEDHRAESARCEELCELLPKATIIHGDATDQELLVEEGIHEADALLP